MANRWRGVRAVAALVALCGVLTAGGCQVLYLLLGQGSQPALYKFGKGQRVLVLVDVADGVVLPPAFPTSLADQIGIDLMKHDAVDVLVPQERLIKLQQTDPGYRGLGVADICRDTDADQVLQVAIRQMGVITTADGTVAQGLAEAYVKVCDRTGRIWPADEQGQPVEARVDQAFLRDKSADDILKEMAGQLTQRTGQMFHSYEVETRHITQ